jgi:pyruvate/2-oxoglutarate/acetoin dehydrogenase E1 component
MRVLASAAALAKETDGISCEVIDLQSLAPWDTDAVVGRWADFGGEIGCFQ